jgi:hypothetical protein
VTDCIRQIIASSPISLSKIIVAPTTSAPAFFLRTSLQLCTFRIFLEQRAVIRFLILKGFLVSEIATELKSVDETEGSAVSTVKK